MIITFLLSHEERVVYVKEILVERNLKNLRFNSLAEIKGWLFLFSRMVFISHTIIYLLLGFKLAGKFNKRISEYYSNIENRSMEWIRELSVVYLLVSVLAIVLSVIGRSYFCKHELLLVIPSVVFSAIYFAIGYNGNKQISISQDLARPENSNIDFEEIDLETEKNLKKMLKNLFEKEKIYRHSDLRITMISESLQINRTYISHLINEEFGMNFNEFVNQYHVREAEELRKSGENNSHTLNCITEKVGFGSCNSFTRAFKEYKGITPGQFRKHLFKQNRLNKY